MSPHDPPAPDLGAKPFTPAQRAQQLERMNSTTGVFLAGRLLINRYEATVVALEQENTAQAAWLASVEAERDQARRELELQQGSFAAVVAERDQAKFQARANADTANLNWQRIEELQAERDAARAEVVIQQQVAGATQLLLDRAEQARAAARSALEEHRIAYTALTAERDELKRLVEGSSKHQGELLRAYEQERDRATRLAAAVQWAVTTLDGYREAEIVNGLPGGTEHWMAGWAEWLEQQARPALAAPPGAGA